MKPLTKVTFFLDNFLVGSPGQQLLDRFLIGYNHGGDFYSPGCGVDLVVSGEPNAAIDSRVAQHRLRVVGSRDEAIRNCACAVVAAPMQVTEEVVSGLPGEARCFVYGPIAESEQVARHLLFLAEKRKIALRAGTAASGAFQLPPVEVPGRVRRAVIVTSGRPFEAEADALDALFSLVPPDSELASVVPLRGEHIWDAAYSPDLSALFAAAFSRSNTIQGDPVRDGRTQDVAGLRLVEKLVAEPRGWQIDCGQTRVGLFVLNSALEDLNIAFESASGEIVSTQLYRPPAPMQDHFSNLAASIEDFFRRDEHPSPQRGLVTLAKILGLMRVRPDSAS